MKTFVVGIGGVTNGGKTTITDIVAQDLSTQGICVHTVHQDDYFKEAKDVAFDEEGGYHRWDEFEAFNMPKMMKDVHNEIETLTNSCSDSVLIIEGILIFNYKELNDLMDQRYFIVLDKKEALARRMKRTYEPSDTPNIFESHVWPMYVKYFAAFKNSDSRFTELDGTSSIKLSTEQILRNIMLRVSDKSNAKSLIRDNGETIL